MMPEKVTYAQAVRYVRSKPNGAYTADDVLDKISAYLTDEKIDAIIARFVDALLTFHLTNEDKGRY
jgi:hypothetical protein